VVGWTDPEGSGSSFYLAKTRLCIFCLLASAVGRFFDCETAASAPAPGVTTPTGQVSRPAASERRSSHHARPGTSCVFQPFSRASHSPASKPAFGG
jgi:hypothetical protein